MHKDAEKTRIALVTGANRGIGLAIAKGLSADKHVRVLAAARRVKDARAAAESIGDGTVGVALDLSDPLAIEPQALESEEDHGPIDILVNHSKVQHVGSSQSSIVWVY